MIFADSSFFIAALREKDRWHKDALKLAGKILYEYFHDNCRIEFINEEMMEKSIESINYSPDLMSRIMLQRICADRSVDWEVMGR
jgi:predicted nucleic acid-binding protein